MVLRGSGCAQTNFQSQTVKTSKSKQVPITKVSNSQIYNKIINIDPLKCLQID